METKELQTILGTDIPITTRGILYLCHYDYQLNELTVLREILCESAFDALTLYSEIPNPESQLATGRTFDDLIKELHVLHKNMKDKKWLEQLSEQL